MYQEEDVPAVTVKEKRKIGHGKRKDMRRRNTEERSRAEAEERHLFTLPCILNSMVNFTERTDMTSTDMTNNWIVKLTELPF